MNKKGFTLIELLIVVTIIGILAVALVPRIVGGSAAARDARRQTDLQTIATGMEYYLSEIGTFVALGAAGEDLDATDYAILSAYIGAFPSDPGDTDYRVIVLSDGNGNLTKYALVAELELPATGDDFVYSGIPTGATYAAFTGALNPYTDSAVTGYFIVY
ncbi:MAG: type II secretion system protein [Patescibacteria group bacterium]|nr:type II secretion system GspH family protein [Patescibacteria group bacterium]